MTAQGGDPAALGEVRATEGKARAMLGIDRGASADDNYYQ
jgi:hypothetical protein